MLLLAVGACPLDLLAVQPWWGEGVVGRWVYAVGLAWIGHCFAAQPGYLLRVLWTFWLFSADGRSKNFHVHTVHVRLSGNSRFAAKHHDV